MIKLGFKTWRWSMTSRSDTRLIEQTATYLLRDSWDSNYFLLISGDKIVPCVSNIPQLSTQLRAPQLAGHHVLWCRHVSHLCLERMAKVPLTTQNVSVPAFQHIHSVGSLPHKNKNIFLKKSEKSKIRYYWKSREGWDIYMYSGRLMDMVPVAHPCLDAGNKGAAE